MAKSRVQLLSKKLVKPSSPTPHQLQHYRLSLMDQLATGKYIPIALFFPSQCYNDSTDTTPTSFLLEKSLSNLLTSYPPFAGRLVYNFSIDCNDMGATFIEARVKCTMSEILNEPHASVENTLFPRGLSWGDSYEEGSLVVAQLTHFDCGGKALSLCLSHKLGDGATLSNFLSDWAAMARQSVETETPCPHFNIGTSLYPPIDDPLTQASFELEQEQHIPTRVAFSASKLNQLKAVVAAESEVHNPTRVEVVFAFLTKCALAASRTNLDPFKPFVLVFPVNLRPLLTPPLPPSSVGNIVSLLPIPFVDEGEMKLSRFVSKLRQAKVELFEKYKAMKHNEIVSALLQEKEELAGKGGFDTYRTTSFCNYPLYNLDFGWGRPIKVTLGSMPTKNSFILTDDQNGNGVEAILSLDEQVMSRFESEGEILEFASLHPTTLK